MRKSKRQVLFEAGLESLDNFSEMLDTMDGMIQKAKEHGWDEQQARALVLSQFLYKFDG